MVQSTNTYLSLPNFHNDIKTIQEIALSNHFVIDVDNDLPHSIEPACLL